MHRRQDRQTLVIILNQVGKNFSSQNNHISSSHFDFAGINIIQPKLKVSRPNDKYELEADAIAN
ncbi:hypothetical protein Ngar_c07960 [Candidatus Nitrososphaera gargensis Ga9.2]|uniref:Uncharacterized protein n=1 Tax=Nitrososphaera gargensis (strain Ga9.2) TaxID=1237085 RepID=K0IG05_NITGG|nr:hypothetical protein Ngar_c07960 [Candidatus Nitrososphaera gargensis Ga9.2]